MEPILKICTDCKVEKSIDEFHKSTTSKDKHQYRCKNCKKQYQELHKKEIKLYGVEYRKTNLKKIKNQKKQYGIDNKEEISNKNKQYRIDNKIKLLLKDARIRAEEKGIKFNLTEKDLFPLPLICPIFNKPLVLDATGIVSYFSPSIDRINNFAGYTKENIRIISYRANMLKSNASKEDIQNIINYMSYDITEERKSIFPREVTNKKLRKLRKNINNSKQEKPNLLHENLSIEDLRSIAVTFCPVLGIKLDWLSKGKAQNNFPSIDRFDNTKGYTKENIRIISYRANFLKKDATLEEMKLIYEKAFEPVK